MCEIRSVISTSLCSRCSWLREFLVGTVSHWAELLENRWRYNWKEKSITRHRAGRRPFYTDPARHRSRYVYQYFVKYLCIRESVTRGYEHVLVYSMRLPMVGDGHVTLINAIVTRTLYIYRVEWIKCKMQTIDITTSATSIGIHSTVYTLPVNIFTDNYLWSASFRWKRDTVRNNCFVCLEWKSLWRWLKLNWIHG